MENKFIRTMVLGVSAMVGFAVTELTYNIGVKWLNKEQEKNIIEMEEIPFEELESEQGSFFYSRDLHAVLWKEYKSEHKNDKL